MNEFGRLMSLNVGEKSVGVAMTDVNLMLDSERSCAFSRKDQTGQDKLADIVACELKDMITKHNVKGVVIGVPIGSAATSNFETRRIQSFVEGLAKTKVLDHIPYTFQDESSITQSAKIKAECLNLSSSSSHSQVKGITAELIMQRYVDRVQREV